MGKKSTIKTAQANLPAFAAEIRANYESFAHRIGPPFGQILLDPHAVGTPLQALVDDLPIDNMAYDDWAHVHANLLSYVAWVMEHRLGATWDVVAHPDPPGYRYLLTTQGLGGMKHRMDPFETVNIELGRRPINISRMLAAAHTSLGGNGSASATTT